MFDFAWSEIAVIGVVALVAIGPKDMPVAIKSMARFVKKARSMASEFQTHVDDLMKEADLGEMRNQLGQLRQFNLRDQMTRVLDPDSKSARGPIDQPLDTDAVAPESYVPPHGQYSVREPAAPVFGAPAFNNGFYRVPPPDHLRPLPDTAPAFIPPDAVAGEQALRQAPAFIPPADVRRGLASRGA